MPTDFKTYWEAVAVDQFLRFYNREKGSRYQVFEHQDSPDFRCVDPWDESELKVEVTLALDAQTKDPLAWQDVSTRTDENRDTDADTAVETVLAVLRNTITKKFDKRYGKNCALIVYHLALPWRWGEEIERLKTEIDYSFSPYDRGVWFVTHWDEFYCLHEGRLYRRTRVNSER